MIWGSGRYHHVVLTAESVMDADTERVLIMAVKLASAEMDAPVLAVRVAAGQLHAIVWLSVDFEAVDYVREVKRVTAPLVRRVLRASAFAWRRGYRGRVLRTRQLDAARAALEQIASLAV